MLHPFLAMAALAPCCAVAAPLRPPVEPACISSPFGWRHAVGPHAAAAGTVLRDGAAVDPEPLLGVPRCR